MTNITPFLVCGLKFLFLTPQLKGWIDRLERHLDQLNL